MEDDQVIYFFNQKRSRIKFLWSNWSIKSLNWMNFSISGLWFIKLKKNLKLYCKISLIHYLLLSKIIWDKWYLFIELLLMRHKIKLLPEKLLKLKKEDNDLLINNFINIKSKNYYFFKKYFFKKYFFILINFLIYL